MQPNELFATALRHHQAGRLGEAERLYREILQSNAAHGDALHCLGVIAHQRGRNDIAVELITRAITHAGRVPAFHNNLGNAFKAQGKLQEALNCYQQALAHGPNYAEAHYNLGITLHAMGRLEEAVAAYRNAIQHRSNQQAEAHNNLGNALQELGRLDEAVEAYRRAIDLKPGYAEALGNLANVRKAQGALEEALNYYARALALKPDYAEALNNMGIVLLEQGKPDEAAAYFQKALEHKPSYAEASCNLGNAFQEQGNPPDARIAYARALALNPGLAEARLGSAIAAIPIFADSVPESEGAPESFLQSLSELSVWSRAHPGKLGKVVGAHQPFYLAYRPSDITRPLACYGDLIAAAASEYRPSLACFSASRAGAPRIRIGVISGQIRQHPVWEVILRGLIAELDRDRFEIILYHTGALIDEETAWARSQVMKFVQGPKRIQAWIEDIQRDGPDVLLYPEVGMEPATGALAALRLAPLQIAAWGHPVTSGLPTMDWFMSGELIEWVGAHSHYREKLLRLPGTGVCTEWTEPEVHAWAAPARGREVVRFALCHQPIKFDPDDDILLARIAKAAGRCEFWLASPKKLEWSAMRLRSRLAAAFRAEGLDPEEHLRLVPWLPRPQFLGFLDEMDIYLDCPAFSGYTTARQALHRGLPIVTLEGEFLRQRLAAGLLRQSGIPEGIALSREEYMQIARSWAQECRQSRSWQPRRDAIRKAALKADGNLACIRALEQAILRNRRN